MDDILVPSVFFILKIMKPDETIIRHMTINVELNLLVDN